MSFQIGQVIYVLSNKTQTVLPGIVLEEIYHKRIDGDSVSYKIAIGPSNNRKMVDLTKVAGDVYGSLDEIREVLLSKVTAFVDDLCEQTEMKADEWYGNEQTLFANSTNGNQQTDEKIDPATLLKEMNQTIPQQQMQIPQPQQRKPTARSKIRNQMAEPDLLQRDIIMTDGTIAKVTMNTEGK